MTVLAHGLGGRLDLPVPVWLFVYGAAVAVVVSFVALAVLWRTPRLEPTPDGRARPGRVLPGWLQAIARSRAVEVVVRAFGLVAFLVVIGAAISGDRSPADNLASVVVFIWLWVGLAFAHALFGNLWATLSPFDTLARILDLGRTPRRPYPAAWGVWPAVVGVLAFVWLELVDPNGSNPERLLLAMSLYTVITLGGMAVYGREAWGRSAEFFAAVFGLLARMAVLSRDADGRVVARPPLSALPALEPRPGLVALVMVLIGSTAFDGLSGSQWWAELVGSRSTIGQIAIGTIGLLAMVGIVTLAYVLSMAGAGLVAGMGWHPLAVRFAHSLVPIAFAYAVAHYFSLLVLEGQLGIALLSDPFAQGWDLFGTHSDEPNLALLSVNTIWYVQVAAIVGGHVGGVVLAHDRAVAVFPERRALRTQYALLAIMVLFTVGGLLILSGA